MPAGVIDVEVGVGQREFRQDAAQAAALQVFVQVPFRTDDDALAVEGPAEDDVAVVAGQRAMDLDRLVAAVLLEAPDAPGVVVLAVHDAAVGGQVGQGVRRAVAFQVGRRGAQEAAVAQDAAGVEAGVGQVAEADGEVVTLLDQVDGAVGDVELDFDFGVALGEGGDQRGDHGAAEAERGVDPQQAARRLAAAGDQLVHGAQFCEQAGGVFDVELAFAGQADAAGVAVDQTYAQSLLDGGQAHGGGRRRDVEGAGGGGKAAVAGQEDEEFEFGGAGGFQEN